jgi:hypothetical protein
MQCLEVSVKWLDNKVVNISNNCYVVNPIKETKRRKMECQVSVPLPYDLQKYNKGVGGVTLITTTIPRPTV